MASIRTPRHVEIAPGSLRTLGPLLASAGRTRAFVVSDAGVARAGITDRAVEVLRASALEARVHAGVPGEPTVSVVDAGAAACRAWRPDVVVGVGGGAVLDVAKAVAALATNPGSLAAYWGSDRFAHPALPMALVPTTAGTGSEVSQFAVVVDEAACVKRVAGGAALLPDLAIVDAELTHGLPPHVTADSGMDAFTHAVEAFLGRGATPYSDALALRAAALVATHLPRAYREPGDRAAREAVMTASTLAGMAFNTAGLGAVHALGYPLDTRHGVPHGRANALLLAPVLDAVAAACPSRLRALGEATGAPSPPRLAERLLAELDIPPRLRDHGVPSVAAARALGAEGWETGTRLLGNSPRALTRADAEGIYADAW